MAPYRMNKPGQLTVLLLSVPFLAGCFTVATVPVPRTQPEREQLDVRGVVITDGRVEEVIEFDQVLEATWTPSALSIIAASGEDEDIVTETRLIPISELRGVLVRTLDAGATSAIIGGVIVGGIAGVALWVTGRGGEYQPR